MASQIRMLAAWRCHGRPGRTLVGGRLSWRRDCGVGPNLVHRMTAAVVAVTAADDEWSARAGNSAARGTCRVAIRVSVPLLTRAALAPPRSGPAACAGHLGRRRRRGRPRRSQSSEGTAPFRREGGAAPGATRPGTRRPPRAAGRACPIRRPRRPAPPADRCPSAPARSR